MNLIERINSIYKNAANVLIVGDVMKDVYISGSTNRVSPEAPVPIVRVRNCEFKAGGASNVAVNLATLGLKVTLLSFVGDDESSNEIENLLTSQNIRCIFLRVSNVQTTQKHRIISQNQQIIRLDYEQENPEKNYTKKNYSDLLKVYKKEIISKKYFAVLLSDYKKGVLKNCNSLITATKKIGLPIYVDPKGSNFDIYKGATFLKPNLSEFENIVGISFSESEFNSKAKKLKSFLKIENLLITKGQSGLSLFEKNKPPVNFKATNLKEVFDVTGAGDTVLAAIVAASALKFTIVDSVKIANASAGVVVGKFGTSSVSPAEFKDICEKTSQKTLRDNGLKKTTSYSKASIKVISGKLLKSKLEITKALDYIKNTNKRLVFTNGCFDIIHAGHISLLKRAKACGDVLMVAVNSDESVKNLKGKSRPVNCINDRIEVIKSIECVDFLVVFNESTPEKLIKFVKPSVLVKGGDYVDKNIVGSEFVRKNGGKIKIIPIKINLSTTKILDKIGKEM